MRNYEEIQAMVTLIEAKQSALAARSAYIIQQPVPERSVGDKVFMMNGGGTRECQALTNQLDALAWVLESR